ncbi:DNA polymerase III subunit delta [Ehrlichia ruminantium]|uniref:DNA-directed DNA polymerase n=1 Tax=Ehrlichia ruminantium (strain Welgevonden) TaxID=254945 RepID=A0A0H3M7H9_EHRRW|nr:DNA polymerase III subunit delta [Ehrlichia ruminantium]QLK50166.1 DNA polymerase III subunit delta [Ehrlichia ruminantium]QLK51091.1 DNA polymerase III subunit delta [Ehrlichia ruminantium]QLK54761.1 DNA polymerase III subunit delta [Ehrlichia ruminantium]QLK55681.1 DNA polymerase III subunit delta [Ehrlichia ruminantium]QLK58426.1 DNA polymerase III subunit delta [Ehrlichia ruminantium]
MKITSSKLRTFLSDPQSVSNILIYGNDYGKISMYRDKIISSIRSNVDFTITNIDFPSINKNPGTLFVELSTVPMFCTRKLLILTNGEKVLSNELRDILEHNIGNNYVIIIAGELPNDSTLRQYYDSSSSAVSIGCYKDDNNNLAFIVSDFLTENNVQFNNEILQYLCHSLSKNPHALQSELEKLILYIGNSKNLTIQSIQEGLLTELDPVSDDLYISIVERDIENFTKFSNILLKNKFTPILLIRVLLKYFLRLEYIIRTITSGIPIDQVLKLIQPPVFFKLVPIIKKHVVNVSYDEVNYIIRKLLEIEIQCKKSDSNHEIIFKHYVTAMMKSRQNVRK